jgi:molybdopterin-guanine dinucleotide biosynthesis protein A
MEAVVLAGGEEAWARKHGVRSKALVPYRGRPMAEWVLEALKGAGLSAVYVGENPGLFPAPRLTLPDQGSLLVNLEAALAHVEGRVLVATADIPHRAKVHTTRASSQGQTPGVCPRSLGSMRGARWRRG